MRALAGVILFACALIGQAHAAATLLPPGENCFQATTGINGMVGTLGTISGGSGGTNGTYSGVALTGGSGSGATANITVSGGAVTAVAILSPGTQYVVGDTLSAASGNIGNVTGFSVPVASVAINSSLAGGQVFFYIPNTTTFKQTWSNAAQTVLNTNPVTLDQNGCAVIYGTGSYRQILQDSLGNTVWDQTTTDTSATNNTVWAGLAGGTPNVITIVDAGFNGTDGSIVGFSAIATNTSSVTVNPSGFGAIPLLKVTTAGPVALSGNGTEIVQGNPVWMQFSASLNSFLLTNPPIQSASGATSPMCGAVGLKITNGGTPNTIISLTANQAIAQTAAGLVINRSTVSLTNINTTTGTSIATANGFDGESIPASTAGWLYVWLIDNGAAPAGLLSLASGNGLSPNLPSGYTYKCRLGAMRFDTSGNLLRILQLGSTAQYVVTPTSNTTALPVIATGNAGNIATGTYAAESVSASVPPTATTLRANLYVGATSQSGSQVGALVAPNANYGTTAPLGSQVITAAATQTETIVTQIGELVLESTNVYYACAGGGCTLSALGWKDAVNAN